MFDFRERLAGSPGKSAALASILLFIVGYIDHVTGYEISLSYFYLLPVLLVTWNVDLRSGLLFSFLAAIMWHLNDHWFVPYHYSQPLIPYWNTLVRLAFFVTVSGLSARIKSLLERERVHSKLKSSMLHTVSHEFNNSLTVLGSGLFLLRETEPTPVDDARRKVLAAMDETRVQLSRYVKNILSEARMEAGKFKLEKTSLALRELINECVVSMRGLIDTKGLELETIMPESPVFLSARTRTCSLLSSATSWRTR